MRRLVPSWSFLTRLRRPYLFPCAGKDRGEKGAWLRLVHAASEFRRAPMFWSGVPLGGHLTSFSYAPPDTEEPDLQLVALERLLSIEGADEIRIDVTFSRGKAPLPGADSPYQGEMSRRDKRGRDAGSAQPRLRGCIKFATTSPSRLRRATSPSRGGLGTAHSNGFPYEGKLSPQGD